MPANRRRHGGTGSRVVPVRHTVASSHPGSAWAHPLRLCLSHKFGSGASRSRFPGRAWEPATFKGLCPTPTTASDRGWRHWCCGHRPPPSCGPPPPGGQYPESSGSALPVDRPHCECTPGSGAASPPRLSAKNIGKRLLVNRCAPLKRLPRVFNRLIAANTHHKLQG